MRRARGGCDPIPTGKKMMMTGEHPLSEERHELHTWAM
jgi:hypothetical protein